jgi:glutaredoxin
MLMLLATLVLVFALVLLNTRRNSHAPTEGFAQDTHHSPHSKGARFTLYFLNMADCPYCIEFKPTWEALRHDQRVAGRVTFRAVHSTHPDFDQVVREMQVVSFPSLVLVDERTGRRHRFAGERTQEELVRWIKSHIDIPARSL